MVLPGADWSFQVLTKTPYCDKLKHQNRCLEVLFVLGVCCLSDSKQRWGRIPGWIYWIYKICPLVGWDWRVCENNPVQTGFCASQAMSDPWSRTSCMHGSTDLFSFLSLYFFFQFKANMTLLFGFRAMFAQVWALVRVLASSQTGEDILGPLCGLHSVLGDLSSTLNDLHSKLLINEDHFLVPWTSDMVHHLQLEGDFTAAPYQNTTAKDYTAASRRNITAKRISQR